MALNITLKDLYSDIDKDIVKAFEQEVRKSELNKRPHVLDISRKSLTAVGDSPELGRLYDTFISVVSSTAPITFNSINDIQGHFKKPRAPLAYIATPPLLLAVSYGAIQEFISKTVRNPILVNTVYGTNVTEKPILNKKGIPSGDTTRVEVSNLDIGHIPTANSEYFISPAEQKIATILETLHISGAKTSAIKAAEDALNDINSIQYSLDYEFRKSSDSVFSSLESIFGALFVAVTLHTANTNQKVFGPQEQQILNKLKEKIAIILGKPALVQKYLSYHSSNSVIEDVIQGLGNLLGSSKTKLAKHTTKRIPKPNARLGDKVSLNPSSPIKLNIPTLKGPKLQGSKVNLSSLLALINSNLQHVISANMGGGNERGVLNYRSGRFAGSAKVERLSESRAGMITAFYSYMKNPYQTFEPGFAQGSPASRNPKNLIGTSIREIAATKVGNQLRAISI